MSNWFGRLFKKNIDNAKSENKVKSKLERIIEYSEWIDKKLIARSNNDEPMFTNINI